MQRTIGQCFDTHHSTSGYSDALKTSTVSEDVVCSWLEKVVIWSSVSDSYVAQETSKDKMSILAFLTDLYSLLLLVDDVNFLLKRIPSLGQLLGRLCGNSVLLSCREVYCLLMKCVLRFKVDNPQTPVEIKAKQWALSQLRSTVSYMKHEIPDLVLHTTGHLPHDFNNMCLQIVKQDVQKSVCQPLRKFSSSGRCYVPCPVKSSVPDQSLSLATSLVHYPKCRPLVEELVIYVSKREKQTEEEMRFLESVAQTQRLGSQTATSVVLSYKARVALWNSYLPSFEQEILQLIDKVCSQNTTVVELKNLITSSKLPTGCAENVNLWRVACHIFISFLKQTSCPRLEILFAVFCVSVRKSCNCQSMTPSIQMYASEYQDLVFVIRAIYKPGTLNPTYLTRLADVLSEYNDEQYFTVWYHLIQFPVVFHNLIEACSQRDYKVNLSHLHILCMFHRPRTRQQMEACCSIIASKLEDVQGMCHHQCVEDLLKNDTHHRTTKLLLIQLATLCIAKLEDREQLLALVSILKPSQLNSQLSVFVDHHLDLCGQLSESYRTNLTHLHKGLCRDYKDVFEELLE